LLIFPFYLFYDTRHACRDGWWLNLLYINNFNEDLDREHCIGWSWYLANDMQMFLISPLVIYPFWRWPLIGWIWSAVLLAAATALRLARELQDFGDRERAALNFYEVYSKPWYRYQPYIIGLMLGAGLFHLRKWKAVQAAKSTYDKAIDGPSVTPGGQRVISPGIAVVGWVAAWLFGLWCVYGRAWGGHEFDMSKAATVIFESFSKVGWSLALAWVIFACAEVSYMLVLTNIFLTNCTKKIIFCFFV
jgi:peptidoglycan/LPS O-acetylase OafA/YrhL